MELAEVKRRIETLEEQLAGLPTGTVVYKTIRGKKQPYLQWTENGKSKSRYIKVAEREEVLAKAALRKELVKELRELKAEQLRYLTNVVYGKGDASLGDGLFLREGGPVYGTDAGRRGSSHLTNIMEGTEVGRQVFPYSTNVVCGAELARLITGVRNFRRRDCYRLLERYLAGDMYGRVCVLYGLRRTGKTTLLFQAIQDLSEEERKLAVYIKARPTDTLSLLNRDLRELGRRGIRYVFLDEVTLLDDFIDGASLFSDIFAMQGMKIVLSGTDSLGFWLSLTQELYDRAYTIHTTFIPFREYSYLLGIDDIDEYIQYGGTLRAGELAFDDADALAVDAAFRDDETTRRYIDTAICQNIQHSLLCCKRGNYMRHLWSLYEAGELTGAINRIIESMNHKFLLSTLIRPFKSHDLGSAAQLLEKETDEAGYTDILSRIDRKAITGKLMEMLSIYDQEDAQIGITKAHVAEIKEYLKALDLVVDCPRRSVVEEPEEYVLFTQPGMRYCQAEALVHVLLNDGEFQAFDQGERDLACAKVLEDVRGRMLEDIVLLETVRSLPKNKTAFKYSLSRGEFDMVIYTSGEHTCEAYEVKHSGKIVPRQYHALLDEEQCRQLSQQYGPITKKCVLYRGDSCVLENGIEYRNVEEYLKGL